MKSRSLKNEEIIELENELITPLSKAFKLALVISILVFFGALIILLISGWLIPEIKEIDLRMAVLVISAIPGIVFFVKEVYDNRSLKSSLHSGNSMVNITEYRIQQYLRIEDFKTEFIGYVCDIGEDKSLCFLSDQLVDVVISDVLVFHYLELERPSILKVLSIKNNGELKANELKKVKMGLDIDLFDEEMKILPLSFEKVVEKI